MLTGQGRIERGPAGLYAGGEIPVWGFRNVDYVRYPVDLMAGYVETLESLPERAVSNDLAAFTFDQTTIKSEVAAIKNVEDQYADP